MVATYMQSYSDKDVITTMVSQGEITLDISGYPWLTKADEGNVRTSRYIRGLPAGGRSVTRLADTCRAPWLCIP